MNKQILLRVTVFGDLIWNEYTEINQFLVIHKYTGQIWIQFSSAGNQCNF